MLSDDSIMREFMHLNAVLGRRARRVGGAASAQVVLAMLAGHEIAMEEGFADQLMSQAFLAQELGIRPQSVGTLVSRLVEQGLVERLACADDRRAYLLQLTEAGREAAREVRDEQRVFAQQAFSVLTDQEKEQFANVIVKLNASL